MAKTSSSDAATVRIPPPLVFLTTLVGGVLLHRLVLPWPLELPPAARITGTVFLAAVAVGLHVAALSLFRGSRQDPRPWKETPTIVVTGVYRFSRNPMYVGMSFAQVACGLGMRNTWLVVLVPLALVTVFFTAIRPEEAYLERKFGDSYREYKRSVRRWL